MELVAGADVHHVRISRGFWLARCPVTREQYLRFRLDAGLTHLDDEPAHGDHPARGISWGEAADYCKFRGLRLPTEAEWEYAARRPESHRYPWGNEWQARRCCNAQNPGPEGNAFPADSSPHSASWCGAVGMAGNVAEWCADWYSERAYAHGAAVDPTGPRRGLTHVYQGGSWSSDADECRSAFRNGDEPGVLGNIGLRCVMPGDGP